jgi:type VI secretion system IcmF/VasK family protein
MQVLGALLKGGNIGVIALIVLLLLVWFGGEYLGINPRTRAIIGVVSVSIYAVLYVLQRILAVRSSLAIENRLRSSADEQMASVRPDKKPEVQALQKQLHEAIASLKSSKMGTSALYQLPWYIIIGPPGSGKSTALQESGLNFPYMSQGRKGIRGVGGTRNCDWWFTDQGILLDTAGRYTTELEDREEWLSFLDMLKRCRKRKPINGAIVCVSVADLVKATDEEVEGHVKNIRDRIDELTKRLEQIFPVYLVFTKCDLLNGFVDFFEDFGKSDRGQVWGFTLPYAGPKVESYQALFEAEARKLYGSLCAQRVTALSTERPADKKRRIYGFPLQFAMAHKRLADFTGELFRPNPFQESSVLRGVYFTSGTQEGTPIDQLVSAMSSAFGIQEDAAGFLSQAVDKKSYFINTLFTKIIFGDQNLARSSTRVARRRRALRYASAVFSVATLIVLSITMAISFVGNFHLVHSVGKSAQVVKEVGKSKPEDLPGNLTAFEDLRLAVDRLDRYEREKLPLSLRWGLYRGKHVYLGRDEKSGIRKVYIDGLSSLFIKPCGKLLENEMVQRRDNRTKTFKDFDKLFELVQVYQMLAGKSNPKRELLQSVLREDDRWLRSLGPAAASLPEDSKKFAVTQLDFYVDQADAGMTWKNMTLPWIEYDAAMVAKVIDDLKGGLWVTEAYRDIITAVGATYNKAVSHETMIKGRGRELFTCPDEFHIPGVFTQEAYDRSVKGAIKEKSENLSNKLAALKEEKPASVFIKDLTDIYDGEYATRWQTFLENIQLKNFENLVDASDKLKVLTPIESPFKDLFKGIWEGRRLRIADGDVRRDTKDERKWLDDALRSLVELQGALYKTTSTAPAGKRMISMTDDKLKDAFVKAKVDIEAAVKLADPNLVTPAARALNRALDSSLEAVVRESQSEVDALWKQNVSERFLKEFANRYPFAEAASAEIPIKEFSEVFNAASGTFWKTLEVVRRLNAVIINDRRLVAYSREFEDCVLKAEEFRKALYGGGSSTMQVKVDLEFSKRKGVAEIAFEVGGKRLSSNDNPDMRGELIWSEASPRGAKVDIRYGENQRAIHEKHIGLDWGLLRLLADGHPDGKPKARGPKGFSYEWIFKVTLFGVDQQLIAEVAVEAVDKVHPFIPNFFSGFKCPEKVGP